MGRLAAVLGLVVPVRLLVALLMVFAASVAAASERRVALVMGADNYRTLRQLENAVNDAEAIEETLAGLGFEVTLETNRDLKRMRRALEDFRDEAAGADVALVFFAGHGVEMAGENRLLPVDADASSVEALKASTLPLEEVRAAVAAVGKVGLIMLDACRDDPFGGTASSGRSAAPVEPDVEEAARPGLGRMGRSENVLFAFAAAPGQTAADGAGGNSPFSAALAKYLGTDGLEIRSVLTLVQQEVYDKSLGKQLPYIESGLPELFFASVTRDELPERERLLLAMADITPKLRSEVELVALDYEVPLAPLYGAFLAGDLGKLGVFDRNAKLGEAAKAFNQVRLELQSLSMQDPEVARLRGLAEEQLSTGQFDAARASLLAAADVDARSLEAIETNLKARALSLASTHIIAANAAQVAMQYKVAAADFEKALKVLDRIDLAELPDTEGSRVVQSLHRMTLVYGILGKRDDTILSIQRTLDLARVRFEKDPRSEARISDYANAFIFQLGAMNPAGESEQQRNDVDKLYDLSKQLVGYDLGNEEYIFVFASASNIKLSMQVENGDLDAAEEIARTAIENLLAGTTSRNASDTKRLLAAWMSYASLADVQRARGDMDAAISTSRSALAYAKANVDAHPNDLMANTGLGVAYGNLGKMLLEARRLPEAEEVLLAGLEKFDAVQERDNTNVVWVRIFETLAANVQTVQAIMHCGETGELCVSEEDEKASD